VTEEQSQAREPVAYLYQVVEGPTYATDEYEPALRLLSERFHGELWSYGSYEADMKFGSMRLRVVKAKSRLRLVNYIRFAYRVVRGAHQLNRAPPPRIVVTSYAPFKGGLLALYVARILRATFVCEVNGNYGDPDNFAHFRSKTWRRVRLLQMRLIGSFVLRRAVAVRLLFSTQLESFATLRPGTIVRQCFALSCVDRFYSAPEEKIILSAGFPFEVKGVDVLIAAFTRIARRFPEWKLVLIGHRIPDQLRARGIHHPQIVAFPGMPQTQLARWMSRCAIFALASRSEAMGRVLLEAAAASKCRIATRVGGIPTVIEHDSDGILVQKESVDELSAALELLMKDALLRTRLAIAGKQRSQREFSNAAYLLRFEELILSALHSFERWAPRPRC